MAATAEDNRQRFLLLFPFNVKAYKILQRAAASLLRVRMPCMPISARPGNIVQSASNTVTRQASLPPPVNDKLPRGSDREGWRDSQGHTVEDRSTAYPVALLRLPRTSQGIAGASVHPVCNLSPEAVRRSSKPGVDQRSIAPSGRHYLKRWQGPQAQAETLR